MRRRDRQRNDHPQANDAILDGNRRERGREAKYPGPVADFDDLLGNARALCDPTSAPRSRDERSCKSAPANLREPKHERTATAKAAAMVNVSPRKSGCQITIQRGKGEIVARWELPALEAAMRERYPHVSERRAEQRWQRTLVRAATRFALCALATAQSKPANEGA